MLHISTKWKLNCYRFFFKFVKWINEMIYVQLFSNKMSFIFFKKAGKNISLGVKIKNLVPSFANRFWTDSTIVCGREKKSEAYNYCDREQTRECIGRGCTLWLTTLWRGRGSGVLLLQRVHLLLVRLLFLCKARNPRVLL